MNQIKKSSHQSIPHQSASLEKRHKSEPIEVSCCGLKIQTNTGVYATSLDSELMIETVKISTSENFLEIGCGTGIVSIMVAERAHSGVGVDINELAVENSKYNAQRHDVTNVEFFISDLFENVQGKFDVIICNPPYTRHSISDNIDRMYWDPEDEMKKRFFKEAGHYLKENGRIYFGWANFGDIDVDLPFKLAEKNGYSLVGSRARSVIKYDCDFFVLEFKKDK
ncbi:MAG: methyltransferase [bacterium]|nr:methyltransferase [bacterium]